MRLRCPKMCYVKISVYLKRHGEYCNETKSQESYISSQGTLISLWKQYDINGRLRLIGKDAKCFHISMFYLFKFSDS